ncbi:formate--tetrahydrofolate ligase [Streptococcus pneumoniae]|nr:formate--tetrahydrofolate ligase [Streptococcus pneumoniae]
MDKKKLLLIDGSSVAFRAFFALYQQLDRFKNAAGLHTNAIYGFQLMLSHLLERVEPSHILVAFDAGKTTFRTEMYADYKGGRAKTPDEFREQFPFIRELLDHMGIRHYELAQYEADDIIGTLDKLAEQDGFDITVASEIMAILCLATDIEDLKRRLANIVIGYRYDRTPVSVGDLQVEGALALILKDAIKPNLVQTIYGTPAFVHGGPFANIAHGCNSVLATTTALHLADYTVTEAGFGADLGAEKFLDIKTPNLPTSPDAVVIVATLRALKMNGGVAKDALTEENVEAVRAGFANLKRHVENIRKFGIPAVVAINEFVSDTEAEIAALKELCASIDVPVELASVWADGAEGGVALAETVVKTIAENPANYKRLYDNDLSVQEKIEKIVTEIYRGSKVNFEKKAQTQIAQIVQNGWDKLPICMAKTQYSFSDNPNALGAPENFEITIRELVPKLGAGFIVALTGDVMTMPGLPKRPAALNMDVESDGTVLGLF